VNKLPFFRCPVLALTLLAVLAMLWPEAASAASYGCGICGHPSYHPWHYSSCRYYGLGLGSSGGSRRSSGGSGGGEALGNAVSGLIDGFFQRMAEQQQRAAALAAERRRQEALARERERQRQEQLRRARIRLAAHLRADWDRRDAEISQRLAGVFDVFVDSSVVDLRPDPVPGGTSFFGLGGSEPFVDSSVVDLRPEPTPQQRLESLLRLGGYAYDLPPAVAIEVGILTGRLDPAFLEAQEQRAAATDAFATENYGFSRAALGEAGAGDGPGGEIVRELLTATDSEALGAKLKALGSRALDEAGDAAESGLAALEKGVAKLPFGLPTPTASAAELPEPRRRTPPADGRSGGVAADTRSGEATSPFGKGSVRRGEAGTAPRADRPGTPQYGNVREQLDGVRRSSKQGWLAPSGASASDRAQLGFDSTGERGTSQGAAPVPVVTGHPIESSDVSVPKRFREDPEIVRLTGEKKAAEEKYRKLESKLEVIKEKLTNNEGNVGKLQVERAEVMNQMNAAKSEADTAKVNIKERLIKLTPPDFTEEPEKSKKEPVPPPSPKPSPGSRDSTR